MPDLGLTIDGVRYSGWKDISVHRSIEHISGGFEITMSEIEPEDPTLRALVPGPRCTIDLDGDTVLTGWIDEVRTSWSADRHDVSVRGRDVTGDLVDCAAVLTTHEWNNRKLEQIVAAICAPFDIEVLTMADTGRPFDKEGTQDGETAFQAIDRLCRQRAILPMSDGLGRLLLTRAGTNRTGSGLSFGENLISGEFVSSDRERFSEYIVRGSREKLENWGPEASTEVEGRAADPAIERYRPWISIGEVAADNSTLKDRARWEASVRAGRGRSGIYTVAGWRDGTGALWSPNQLVSVRDPFAGVQGEMLTSAIEYTKGPRGTRTAITLVRPDAFDLIELPPPTIREAPLWSQS